MQEKSLQSPEIYWVLGCGQFGRRAVELLKRETPTSKIVVVDKRAIRDLPVDIETVCTDGVEWLAAHLTQDATVSRIIPSLPIHLAAAWLKLKLSEDGGVVHSAEIPDEHLDLFPNPIRLTPSQLVTSHADFLCPPNCSEPAEICTYTKRQRPPSLYHLLETMTLGDFVPLILRSRQFASGVGGYYPEDLWNLLLRARLLPGKPLLIGTACKCHGIVDGLCPVLGV